jgi:hypothetical protein
LINNIKQNNGFGNNISTSLANQEPIITKDWKPSMEISKTPEKAKNQQFQIKFKADYKSY